MIIDEMSELKNYISLNPNFAKVLDFLNKNKIENFSQGRYEIEGLDIYLNIDEYVTKEINESNPEAHRNYIDIQIVLKGNEVIGYNTLSNSTVKKEYNKEKDIEFFESNCEYIKACAGRFFIFFPNDVHHPCISDGKKSNIKKAVFKIKI